MIVPAIHVATMQSHGLRDAFRSRERFFVDVFDAVVAEVNCNDCSSARSCCDDFEAVGLWELGAFIG